MERRLSPTRLATLVDGFNRSPAYRGLRLALQELIGDGRIPMDTRLPSERAVAMALGLSRNTVARVYGDLVTAGFAQARVGAGTYATVPEHRRRAHDHALHALGAGKASDGGIDLNCAASAATPGVAAAYARALEALPSWLGTDGYLPSGLPPLQAAIADAYARRGLPTDPSQVIVTSGALSALAIVARALTRAGDRVMLETPVYSNAIEALKLGGARLVASPLGSPSDGPGWDLDGIEATLRQTAPHLAYLIPDFQNPTGLLMPDAMRAQYAAMLRAARTVPIIDEALQGTSLTDAPMPAPFAAHARDAVTIGSASKLFWGGLRVGWIRAPRERVESLVRARVQMDLGTSVFDQLVVAGLMADPGIADTRRAQLRARRDALVAALREHLPDWRFRVPDGGLTLWIQLPHGSATQFAADMEPHGVHLAPGPVFSVEGGADQWLRLPYAWPEERLQDAVRRMAAAWPSSPAASARKRTQARRLVA